MSKRPHSTNTGAGTSQHTGKPSTKVQVLDRILSTQESDSVKAFIKDFICDGVDEFPLREISAPYNIATPYADRPEWLVNSEDASQFFSGLAPNFEDMSVRDEASWWNRVKNLYNLEGRIMRHSYMTSEDIDTLMSQVFRNIPTGHALWEASMGPLNSAGNWLWAPTGQPEDYILHEPNDVERIKNARFLVYAVKTLMNIRNGPDHWFAIVYDQKESTVFFVDSMVELRKKTRYEYVFKHFNNYLSKNNIPQARSWHAVRVPQQITGWSCGLFVAENIGVLLRGYQHSKQSARESDDVEIVNETLNRIRNALLQRGIMRQKPQHCSPEEPEWRNDLKGRPNSRHPAEWDWKRRVRIEEGGEVQPVPEQEMPPPQPQAPSTTTTTTRAQDSAPSVHAPTPRRPRRRGAPLSFDGITWEQCSRPEIGTQARENWQSLFPRSTTPPEKRGYRPEPAYVDGWMGWDEFSKIIAVYQKEMAAQEQAEKSSARDARARRRRYRDD